MKRTLITVILALLCSLSASAQKWSVSTNILDWAYFGTLNVQGSVAVQRYLTVNAELKYNPWTFNNADPSTMINQKQITADAGIRYWPWHIYSGWWFGFKLQYQQYNMGGLFHDWCEEGDAFGGGLSAGYTLMLHKHLNIEFSAGAWGGYSLFTRYSCPKCGRIMDSGGKGFVMPNDVAVALVWIF